MRSGEEIIGKSKYVNDINESDYQRVLRNKILRQ